jgi:Flp pilus assembly protein TadG
MLAISNPFARLASPQRATFKAQSGQALIELAFIVPILLALALGVIEIGRYAYIGILVGNAARAGAAYGSQNVGFSGDTNGIANAAKYDYAGAKTGGLKETNGMSESTLTVNSTVTCGCDNVGVITTAACSGTLTAGTCAAGHWVITLQVTASGNFNAMFNYPGIPSPLAVSRVSEMRVAQ